MISKITYFMEKGIWEIRLTDLSPVKAFFVRCLRVVLLALRGFMKNGGQKTASVLTYYSLLNLVPIIGVAFGIAKGFGLENLIESRIQQMAQEANWQVEITHEIAFQPGRSIDQLTIQQVLQTYDRRGENEFSRTPPEEAEKISNYLKEISEAVEKSPANVRLKEI